MGRKAMKLTACSAGLLSAVLNLCAQQSKPNRLHASTDVAVLVSFEQAQVAQTNGTRFWLNGGSIDATATFYRGLGLAANVTGEHASNFASNINLNKVAFMVGPRFTFDTSRLHSGIVERHKARIFVEALFGGARAFDSVFPGTSSPISTATAFSMQLGGGIDVALKHGFGFRVLELDYIHTTFSNNAANAQNDFHAATGFSYRR